MAARPGQSRLQVRPCTLVEALGGVRRLHRHLPPPPGALAAFVIMADDRPVGWGLIGRPVSPVLARRGYVELTRLATDGTPNACSAAYGYAARWARGRQRPIIIYTLPTEPGTSLRAAGWTELPAYRRRDGGQWSRPSRPRPSRPPELAVPKRRWTAP